MQISNFKCSAALSVIYFDENLDFMKYFVQTWVLGLVSSSLSNFGQCQARGGAAQYHQLSPVSKVIVQVWGVRVEKPSQWATVYSVFSTIARPFQALLL